MQGLLPLLHVVCHGLQRGRCERKHPAFFVLYGVFAMLHQRVKLAHKLPVPACTAPVPHGFVCEGHAAFRPQLLDIAITAGEMVVQPHAVADDLGGNR